MPAWILLLLPQLIAGLGQLIGSSTAVQRQNRYNSPFMQLQRLREAGLPYAAFQAGQAGNQSNLPDLSGFNTLGNAVGTSLNQGNQLKMFSELLRKAMADADVSENLRDVSNEETEGLLSAFGTDPDGNKISLARYNKLLDVQLKEYGAIIQKNASKISKIDRLIKEARYSDGSLMDQAKAEFDAIVLKNDLIRQQWKSNDARNAAFNKVIDFMKGSDGKLGFMESLLILLAGSFSGGFSKGGMNFGF